MQTPTSRTLTAAALGATLLAGGAIGTGSATAAGGKAFDLYTAAGANHGRAHGYGKISFVAPKSVKISGRINDLCPGDGFGSYIEFKVNFVGGGYGTTVRSDRTKCSTAHGVGYSFTSSFPRKVKSVGITVIEIDQTSRGPVYGDAARKLINR
jgi:hypothetical protein